MTRQLLRAHDIHVDLGQRPVLKGVTLDLKPGEVTAILGPNGAGKSTLLSCLAGLRTPRAGSVSVGEVPIGTLALRARAQRLALLPQNAEIAWPITVDALVSLGRIPHQGPFGMNSTDRAAVAEALATTRMEAFAGRRVTELSGGERTRALLARVLAGRPEWILADEPLTGLDPGHALDALLLFRAEAQSGRGVVLTLHDLTLVARVADRVVVLLDGGIVADGTPKAALTPQVLASAYGVKAAIHEGPGGLQIEIEGRV